MEDQADGELALAGGSPRLRRVALDVTSDDWIAAAFGQIETQLARAGLDGVINHAGVGFPGPLEALPIRRRAARNASAVELVWGNTKARS